MEKYLGNMFFEMKNINNKIKNSLQEGDIIQAKKVISDYKKKLPNDTRIPLLEVLILLEEGKTKQAKKELLEGINRIHPNYEINYCVSKANKSIQEKNFIEALNNYERALALSENLEFKKDLRGLIKKIEEKYSNEIQKQIKEEKEKMKIKEINEEARPINYIPNLHLLLDNIYCEKYINFMNEKFDVNDHFFIILCFEKKLKYIKKRNVENVKTIFLKEGWEKCFEENTKEILSYINFSNKIFIHYLHDFITWFICKYNISKGLYWVVWGGDLSNYININKYDELTAKFVDEKKVIHLNNDYVNTNEYIYRRATIRRFSGALCGLDEEFKLLCTNFVTGADYISFYYPNPVDFVSLENLKREKYTKIDYKKNFKYVIQLGNSGDPTNNHLDMLNMLKNLDSDQFCVVCPLSYGNQKYISELIKEGKRLLGKQFIPLTEYLSPKEYFEFLDQVDVAIMNHNVPHGLGNILTLLYLGKKVYLKKRVLTYIHLNKLDIKVFESSLLENSNIFDIIEFNDKDRDLNKKKILENYSEEKITKKMKKIFRGRN